MRSVPAYFQAAIKAYDSCLRVRWSTHMETFVLERRMRDPNPITVDKMRGLFYRRANRAVPSGQPAHDTEVSLSKRYVAKAWLEALNDNHRLVETLSGVGDADLRDLQQWLRSSDQWAHANYDGNPGASADRLAAEQLYDENWQTTQRDRTRRVEIRDRAKEMYSDLAFRAGNKVAFSEARG